MFLFKKKLQSQKSYFVEKLKVPKIPQHSEWILYAHDTNVFGILNETTALETDLDKISNGMKNDKLQKKTLLHMEEKIKNFTKSKNTF